MLVSGFAGFILIIVLSKDPRKEYFVQYETAEECLLEGTKLETMDEVIEWMCTTHEMFVNKMKKSTKHETTIPRTDVGRPS